jgi:hypothetical protein
MTAGKDAGPSRAQGLKRQAVLILVGYGLLPLTYPVFIRGVKPMSPKEVRTIAKDRTLIDQVRESPVDQYKARFRLIVSTALIIVLIAIVFF